MPDHLIVTLISLTVGFLIQTVFLLAALWMMIKLQKLNYEFPALLGSAMLASALDMIPFIGHPLAVGVLLFCIWKVTESEYIDVAFTVFVGYAVMFCMNLWLLGMLVGKISPAEAVEDTGEHYGEVAGYTPAYALTNQIYVTNRNVAKTAPLKPTEPVRSARTENSSSSLVVKARELPQPVRETASSQRMTNTAPTIPENPVDVVMRNFSTKGITRGGKKPSVVVNTGVKTYTLFVGEPQVVQVPGGSLAVCLDEVVTDSMVLTVEGEQVRLALR